MMLQRDTDPEKTGDLKLTSSPSSFSVGGAVDAVLKQASVARSVWWHFPLDSSLPRSSERHPASSKSTLHVEDWQMNTPVIPSIPGG